MSPTRSGPLLAAVAALAVFVAPSARAETRKTCTGFVDAAGTTISEKGVWCLRADLIFNPSNSGPSVGIRIATSDVTLDCGGYRLRTERTRLLIGIWATAVPRVVVRDCIVEGFTYGIRLEGGYDHAVQDNRVFAAKTGAILVAADGSVVRDNVVDDTSGLNSVGIRAVGTMDIVGNVVRDSGRSGFGDQSTIGLLIVDNAGGTVADNSILGGYGNNGSEDPAYGIRIVDSRPIVRANYVAEIRNRGIAIGCNDATVRVGGNVFSQVGGGPGAPAIVGCRDIGNTRFP